MSYAVACRPAVAFPDHVLTAETLRHTLRDVLGDDFPHLGRLVRIAERSGIARRHLVRPLAETLRSEDFGTRNALYVRESKRLVEEAARGALVNAALDPGEIDLVITTSCTGLMIPSVCAHLIPTLGFRPQTTRLPITELGCAAGAVALSRAREYLQCYPGRNVLIVAHELCSLTYQPGDRSMQSLVGAMLFGDGAAGVVVRGSRGDGPGLQLEVNASFLFPDSWDYMGFDVRATGLHLILDRGIPGAVESRIRPVLASFLEDHGLTSRDLGFVCLHPGGRKILDELTRVLELDADDTRASHECLAEVGNLSSASILVVLRNLFDRHPPAHGDRGLLTAFGPGFSAEMALGTWVADG